MSFVKRLLQVQFTLGQGQFTGGGQVPLASAGNLGSSLTVGGPSGPLRMSARISRSGGASPASLSLDVWGMKLSDMNTLSTLGYIATTYKKNQVLVKAGDAGSALATVFNGTIYDAYVDLSNQPDARFHVDAQVGLIDRLASAPPSSWKGAVDVATILGDIAGQLGVPFENNGVSVILRNSYFPGSLLDQAQAAVDHARIAWNGLEDGKLAIWLPGQARGGPVPLVSKDTGLQAYPAYNSVGIQFTTVFNPAITFGGKVNVQSSQLLQKQQTLDAAGNIAGTTVSASGVWGVNMLNHRLECLVPNGSWFSDVQCAPVGYVVAP